MNDSPRLIQGVLVGVAALIGVGLYSAFNETSDMPAPATEQPAQVLASPKIEQAPAELPGTQMTDQGHDFTPEMKERLLELSDIYEEQTKYPDFSLPIDKNELETKYLPDIAVANELPARLSDPNSPGLSIKTSRLRYFPGDEVSAIAVISGLPEAEPSSVRSQLLWNGEALAHATVMPRDDAPHSYDVHFGPLQLSQVSQQVELNLYTEFMFQGESFERLTSFEYVPTIARLDGVAPASVNGEYLEIPVYVSTDKPGFHRVKGNLYDATTGEPLVHLRAEEQLDTSSGTLVLKAHIAALKKAGSEGPYELKDLGLQRLPSEPDYITEFGSIEQEVFNVNSFSFNQYSDKPYINEKSQRIAKELRRIGS